MMVITPLMEEDKGVLLVDIRDNTLLNLNITTF